MKAAVEKANVRLRRALETRGSIYFGYTDVVFKYPCLCMYNAGLLAAAKLFNAAVVHVIGDSHVKPFAFRSPFLVHHISQATAYNLNKENSFSQSKKHLNSFLGRINKERDILLLVFGEIDARVQIYAQHRKHDGKTSIGEIIEATVARYGEVILRLVTEGFAVCIHGIPPAARENFASTLPFLGSPEQRSLISRRFNRQLGEFCHRNGVMYIDVQSVSADEEGFMKRQYATDAVHLNGQIVSFARGKIVEAFKGSKCLKF